MVLAMPSSTPIEGVSEPRHAREMFCLHKKISGRYCHCAQYLVWISGPKLLSSSFYTNGLYHSFNMSMPGLIASQSDFGYTSNGLMYTGVAFLRKRDIQGKRQALWGIWQAALSEQFSTSLDEFYEYWSMNVDNMPGTPCWRLSRG